MGTNLHDVYYCQLDRNQELSDRMYKRNIPSVQMGASYFSRPVDTYATVFGMVDNHKQATVKKANFSPYSQRYVFNPGSSAPYDGYSRNVDVESRSTVVAPDNVVAPVPPNANVAVPSVN